MDFRQTSQPSNGRPAVVSPTPASDHKEDSGSRKKKVTDLNTGKWMRILSGVLLVGIAILLAAVALSIGRGSADNEHTFVDSSKYQAVFLNNGQVYFGNIQDLNGNYVRLANIYYLTQTGDSSSSNYSLVKLGCQQIHDPTDEMVINRDQVTFWENLNDNGKVVTSINQFKKQNPNGPDCSQVTNNTQASPTSGTSSQNSTNGTGTGTTTNSSSSTSPSSNSSSSKQ